MIIMLLQIFVFLNFIRPFLVNKGSLNSCKIMVRQEQEIIIYTKEIAQILNDYYFKLKNLAGKKTTRIAKQSYLTS